MALITSYGIHKDRNSMEGLAAYENGGKGSGNFGHSGRPGEVGWSAPSGSGGASGSSKGGEKKKYTKADQIEDDYKAGLITAGERDGLLEKAKADGTSSDEVERPKKETTKSKPEPSKKTQESATEWAKKNLDYPEDLSDKDFDFDEVIARMTNGENFYEFFGQIDSVDREKVFGELADRTGLDYGDVYDAWLGHPTSAAISYTHSLTASILGLRIAAPYRKMLL